MPIEVDQKKLRVAYLFVNAYAFVLAIAPFVAVLRIIQFALTQSLSALPDIAIIAILFPIVAGFWFTRQRMINNLFLGHYYGKDRALMIKLATPSVRLVNGIWAKIPLPYVELNRRVKNWRRSK